MENLYSFFNNLHPIPSSEWKKIEGEFQKRSFKKGEILQEINEIPTHLFILESGLAKASYLGDEGKEFIKSFFAEMDIASSYIEVLREIPSRVEIKALENIEAVTFPFKRIKELYAGDPCWNALGRILAEKFFIMKEQREYEFLMLDARARYENFKEHFGHLEKRISNAQIALYLGITPVSLSRIKSN
tara:strand:- start:37803 stop:38366 length:564 start_codon:yes stop_codon:yes gene_type:complete